MVYLSINLFVNIKISYNIWKYYYLKNKVTLLLWSLFNIIYFDTNCLFILYDNLFFGV